MEPTKLAKDSSIIARNVALIAHVARLFAVRGTIISAGCVELRRDSLRGSGNAAARMTELTFHHESTAAESGNCADGESLKLTRRRPVKVDETLH
jgi:hypothetical protein